MTATIIDPAGIDAAGKGKLIWVETLANPGAPTVAELTAGLDVSCAVYGWNPNGTQGKVERTRYCSKGAYESLGKAKYEADPIEYDYDPQKPTETTGDYRTYAEMTPGKKGYLVDRRGLEYDVAVASTQIVDVYPIELGIQNRVQIDPKAEGEKLRVRQAVAIYADPEFDVAVAAA